MEVNGMKGRNKVQFVSLCKICFANKIAIFLLLGSHGNIQDYNSILTGGQEWWSGAVLETGHTSLAN